jgi:Zn-dependent membrane protease YugP
MKKKHPYFHAALSFLISFQLGLLTIAAVREVGHAIQDEKTIQFSTVKQ